MEELTIYTDGACAGNPGPGGWGTVIISKTERRELSGYDPATTNNRMELQAALEALRAVPPGSRIDLHTDSQYLRDGMTSWLPRWQRNGWRTAAKKPVKNADLWRALIEAAAQHEVHWHWVKGHAGHPENERADELARAGIPDR
jgi:ribonuclease HI